ncbi:adhesion G protein-coupled receptor L3-like isoform X2 [Antedon mediterranea]
MGEASRVVSSVCFLLAFTLSAVKGECNSPTLPPNSWEGTIQNANYGVAVYQNDQSCRWTINMSKGSRVKIEFVSFKLEEQCYDFLEILDENEEEIGKFCGSEIPNPIESSGSSVTVHFQSDNTNGFKGFQLNYTGLCKGIELNATNGGSIESPLYPDTPPGLSIACNWKLITEDGFKIILQYEHYDVSYDECSNDYLKVYDGANESATMLPTTCGNSKADDTSTSNNLIIDYHGGEYSKFKLNYHVEQIMPCEYHPCKNGGECTDVSSTDFTCTCAAGYTGDVCDEDVNECESDPCGHAVECVNEVNKFRCICLDGYAGATCTEDIDECEHHQCENGGVCHDVISGYTCECVNGYRGDRCDIEPEAPSCAAEQDTIEGSFITWEATEPDEQDVQDCPEGTDGQARRKCVVVSESPLEVIWGDPDLSECVSPQFEEVSKLVEELEESPSEDGIIEVLSVLQNITNTDSGSELFPADLDIATDTIAAIVDATETTDIDDVESLVQLFSESVDNIVDPTTTSAWKNSNNPDKAAQTATSILHSTETMAEAIAKIQKDNGDNSETVIKLDNFDLSIKLFDNSTGGNGYFSFGDGDGNDTLASTSSITLPKSVFDVDTENEPDFVGIYSARFKTIGSLLNASSSGTEDQDQYVNGDIVSAKVLGYQDVKFENLSDPVIIVIQHHEDASNEITCVFLNEDSTDAATQWDTTGCVKVKSNSTHTECACNHLTNFAVLMDVHGIQQELDDAHNVALSVLSYIGGTLSIIGCILSIFIFEFFKLKSDRIRVHENLAGAMAASLFVFLVGIDRTENKYVCKTFAILLHYLLTAMFMWMLVEGIHLYLALVKVFGTSSHIKKYLVLGWGVPLVVIGISVGVFFDKYGSDNVCWLSTEMLLIVFVPTVAIVVILNSAVLVIVVRVMLHSLSAKDKIKGGNCQDQETSAIKTSLKAALVLLPLLGLTWVFGFLSVNEYTIIFTYLFAICNSLQGVIFFLFHCLMNVEVKKAYQRRYRKAMAATSSMSTTTTSRVHQSKRRPSAGTDLTKRRTSISSQESYAYDNPVADTGFDGGKSVKRNNEENELKNKALKSTPVKMNDIKVGLTTGT